MKFLSGLLISFAFTSVLFSQGHTPPTTAVQMTPDKWREDLRFLSTEVVKTHKNPYHALTKEEFDKSIAALDARIPSMEDHQVVAEIMRIVASLGDGHTGVRWGMIAASGVFPVSFYVFEDGLFVQKASMEYSAIVGGKVTRIGNLSAEEAIAKLRPLIWRDNEMGVKSSVSLYLTAPRLLHAAGISASKDSTQFTVLKDGRDSKVELKPTVRLNDVIAPPASWIDARNSSTAVPLWQKDPRNNFHFEMLPDAKTFYIQYNAVQDKQDETVEAFFKRAFQTADASPAERLVLDLRLNGGGNNYLNVPMIIAAIKSRLNVPGKFFVIIGRETFSAAMNAVNDLEKYTSAIFVGEPTGASPNHFGDARPITLPNSKLVIQASTLWWQDMDGRDRRRWKAPDVAAELTSQAYRDGRDPALEAIQSYKPAQSLEAIIAEQRVKQDLPVFLTKVREFKANPAHRYAETERRINDIGYFLLGRNQVGDSIEVFKLNTELHPRSANAYDSLGEAYARKGDKANALISYKKALEIAPNTVSALEAVKTLSQK